MTGKVGRQGGGDGGGSGAGSGEPGRKRGGQLGKLEASPILAYRSICTNILPLTKY